MNPTPGHFYWTIGDLDGIMYDADITDEIVSASACFSSYAFWLGIEGEDQ